MSIDTRQIELSEAQKRRLAAFAERTGWTWNEAFDYAVEQAEAASAPAVPNVNDTPSETAEAWAQRFERWISRQTSHNPNVDDSRESIYEDRW